MNNAKRCLENLTKCEEIYSSEDPMGDFSKAISNYYQHYTDDHSSTWCRFHKKVLIKQFFARFGQTCIIVNITQCRPSLTQAVYKWSSLESSKFKTIFAIKNSRRYSVLLLIRIRPLCLRTCCTNICWDMYVAGQNDIQVKIILTQFDSQLALSSNPNWMIIYDP